MSVNPPPQRQRQPTPGSGLQTQTQVQTVAGTQAGTATPAPTILRLRGAHAPSTQRVQWAESVIDNEGLGRKSSKVCCIYHAPREVGESSDESSSDSSSSDSDSDSGGDNAYDARERALAQRRAKDQQHRHGPNCAHGREEKGAGQGSGHATAKAKERWWEWRPVDFRLRPGFKLRSEL
ncbi:hypothetical protein ONZ43_g4338 [Nemania bipapillata]|uniref:Uncharacterized protein n=1 Tax=Nemania bipapillata TaxID=110536 RepID=A0ACC2IP40_9PEZI|nr:hypothetical protein ONZ43_g4338 [Nemania bipapillata]